MKRLKKRMLANSRFSYVITSILMICVLLIGVAVFEVIRLYIQAGAVRDKFEDSIISMCVENYSEMYQRLRLSVSRVAGGSFVHILLKLSRTAL